MTIEENTGKKYTELLIKESDKFATGVVTCSQLGSFFVHCEMPPITMTYYMHTYTTMATQLSVPTELSHFSYQESAGLQCLWCMVANHRNATPTVFS